MINLTHNIYFKFYFHHYVLRDEMMFLLNCTARCPGAAKHLLLLARLGVGGTSARVSPSRRCVGLSPVALRESYRRSPWYLPPRFHLRRHHRPRFIIV
jgi:hypothetical protein